MEKHAETQYPINDLIRRRWSPRAFAARPVEREKLLSILEAARWAPSSNNEQPWVFLVATADNPEQFQRMLSCLVDANIAWAQRVPVLMLSVARRDFERSGKPNRHAFYDVGQAAANLSIEATALGLAVHQMAGILPDKAREVFGIPDDCDAVTAIAIGYPGDSYSLPEELRKRELAPRTRKPLESFVFDGRWGEASPLLSKKS